MMERSSLQGALRKGTKGGRLVLCDAAACTSSARQWRDLKGGGLGNPATNSSKARGRPQGEIDNQRRSCCSPIPTVDGVIRNGVGHESGRALEYGSRGSGSVTS